MEISFTKRGNNGHTISCKRKNGSVTWMQSSSFFITHDLCHYVTETKLGLKKAFYGMVADGTDINDFDLPKDQRAFQLTEEAIFAEQMVNLLTIEYAQGLVENFIETLKSIWIKDNPDRTIPRIQQEEVNEIRNQYEALMNQWILLPDGDTMTLTFAE